MFKPVVSNNPHSTIISTPLTKINSTIIPNNKIKILVFKTYKQKVHSIHLDNHKVIIISRKIISFLASTEINQITLIIKIKINFQINKALNFNQIISKNSNLVNLINKIMEIINLEINRSIHKMELIIINLTVPSATTIPISIQVLTTSIIMATILEIEILILYQINNIKAKQNSI